MALQPLGLTSKIVAYNNEVDLKDKTASPKMQGATVAEVLAFAGSVDGSNSVYVAQQGTAEESGVLLLQAYQDAIAKIASTVFPATDIAVVSYQNRDTYTWRGFAQENVKFSVGPEYQATFSPDGTPMQVLITIISVSGTVFEFDITDLDGNQIPYISGGPDFPAPAYAVVVPSTLIIAPGDYSIASDLILNNIVNVTSLTGQADVNISTSNVKVQSGANNSSHPISIVGLNLTTTSLWIESNLSSLTFKNCNALGTNSFSIEPNGTGSISGAFIDCTGDFSSFGGGTGVTASGLFIRCKTTGSRAFGGGGSTSGYFEYCGGAYKDSSGGVFLQSSLFGSEGVTVNGYFYYCTANNGSFAGNNTGATNAEFYYCRAGSQSFGYRNTNNAGKYYNCTSIGSQVFGSNTLNGDTAPNARYYNCTTTEGMAMFSTLSSRFYNCHAGVNWYNYTAGDGGLAYNCSFGSSGGQLGVTGTGKYRNCLDSSFTIVNLG